MYKAATESAVPRPTRRALLSIPPITAAAVFVARPVKAKARIVECLADLGVLS
jgi:hypothetical protein